MPGARIGDGREASPRVPSLGSVRSRRRSCGVREVKGDDHDVDCMVRLLVVGMGLATITLCPLGASVHFTSR
jgi:hypothetical protein